MPSIVQASTLIFLLAAGMLMTTSSAQNHEKVLRVAISQASLQTQPVLIEDYTQLFKAVGYDIEILVVPRARVLLGLENGSFDAGGVRILPAINSLQNVDYISYPVYEPINIFFWKNANARVPENADLNTLDIGYIRGSYYAEQVLVEYDIHRAHGISFGSSDLKNFMISRLDLILLSTIEAQVMMKKDLLPLLLPHQGPIKSYELYIPISNRLTGIEPQLRLEVIKRIEQGGFRFY